MPWNLIAEVTPSRIPYLGNLHHDLGEPWVSMVLVICSTICGTIIGLERRSRHKPAGLRTVSLISIGSTIFTMTSVLIAAGGSNDAGRIAAQVVTGVGFLGAGAIMHHGDTVLGLTTAATSWVVAAIGVFVGVGYAFPGLCLTLLVVGLLQLHPDSEH